MYNNGIIANDPKLASMNFLNALDKIIGYMEQDEKRYRNCKKFFLFFWKL